jgi:hypothetical protein
MALDVYTFNTDTSNFEKHSKNGLLTDPVQTTHDGTNGETVEKKLFLRNDDTNFFYTNLTLQPLPQTKTAVDDINFPEAFVTFKIIVQNEQPTENQWKSVASGSVVTFPDIGATGSGDDSYKPFWILTAVPAGTRVGNLNDIFIQLNGEDNPV